MSLVLADISEASATDNARFAGAVSKLIFLTPRRRLRRSLMGETGDCWIGGSRRLQLNKIILRNELRPLLYGDRLALTSQSQRAGFPLTLELKGI